MELLLSFHAVISAKCTYHWPYGADSAFNTTSDVFISPSFIAVTYNADELKTFLNRTPKYLAVHCMTVLFAAWHFSLIYCSTLVINIKAHLSFIGLGSGTDALIHFESTRLYKYSHWCSWISSSVCKAGGYRDVTCLYMKYNQAKNSTL